MEECSVLIEMTKSAEDSFSWRSPADRSCLERV